MYWLLKIRLFMILAAAILFISSVNGLKCLECLSTECRKGDDKPTKVNCGPDTYCSKMLTKEYGSKDVGRECSSKDYLHKTGLRLNECGFDKRYPKDKFPECICDSGNYCNSGYDFILSPTGLKCLKCTSDDCLYGIEKPSSISCKKGYYCEKYSYIGKNNKRLIYRNCQRQEYLFPHGLKLNDCGIYVDKHHERKPTCHCNKDDCNSGDNFEPKSNSGPPAIDCQKCDDDTRTKCFNDGYDIDKCEIGYICYKLFEVQSNVNRVVKRGCIHKEYSLDLGLKINECGQFTSSQNEKQPICICDEDFCNSGGLEIANDEKEKEEIPFPCSNSASIYFNQFFLSFLIFIKIYSILIFNK